MLELLLIPVLGLAPGIFWLWLIYGMDKYRPEPKSQVVRIFILGIAIVVPVSIVESLLSLPYIIPNIGSLSTEELITSSIANMAYFSFIVAGFTEELFKFLVVRFAVYKSPYFDEPLDGLIYSSAVALGFASLENIMYLFSFGWEAILIRGPISTVGHVVFSGIWGYPLALRKLNKPRATLLVWLGLLGAMAGHGLFNFIAFSEEIASGGMDIVLWAGFIVLFLGLVAFFIFLFIRGLKSSPFKDIRTAFLIRCPNCQSHVPYNARICSSCNNRLVIDRKLSPVFCGKCGIELAHNMSYCPSCGSRMLKKVKVK